MRLWASLVAQLVASTCNAGDPSSIPGSERSPGERNSYPLQYSGLENSKDCIVDGVAKSDTTELLSLSLQFHFPEAATEVTHDKSQVWPS